MADEIVGKIPEFTTDETVEPESEEGTEEVKEAKVDEILEEETETPAELPAEEKPVVEEEETQTPDEDTRVQIGALAREKEKLLEEIQELRGQRRAIKQDELKKVEEKIDDLKDLHPEDVTLIDRILRSKGYVTKEEANSMFYEAVKQQGLDKFLDKYPEYKKENDPHDLNWSSLEREFSYFRRPEDPHRIYDLLVKAHSNLAKESSGRSDAIQERRLRTAGVGSGGAQRSSSRKTLNPRYRAELERGGWSEEEISEMEENIE